MTGLVYRWHKHVKIPQLHLFIYILTEAMFLLILEREERGEKWRREERDRSLASHIFPNQGSNPQPRAVPQLGIEPAILFFFGVQDNTPSAPRLFFN